MLSASTSQICRRCNLAAAIAPHGKTAKKGRAGARVFGKDTTRGDRDTTDAVEPGCLPTPMLLRSSVRASSSFPRTVLRSMTNTTKNPLLDPAVIPTIDTRIEVEAKDGAVHFPVCVALSSGLR